MPTGNAPYVILVCLPLHHFPLLVTDNLLHLFQFGLICVFRIDDETIPGCTGHGKSRKDYCANPQDLEDAGLLPYLSYKANRGTENESWFSYSPQKYLRELVLCEGDCDNDDQCADNFECCSRDGYDDIPGCNGVGARGKGKASSF